MQTPIVNNSRNGIRDMLEQVITSYQEMDGRFASVGGVGRLLGLYEQLTNGGVDEGWLSHLEWQDNIFPNMDYRLYA